MGLRVRLTLTQPYPVSWIALTLQTLPALQSFVLSVYWFSQSTLAHRPKEAQSYHTPHSISVKNLHPERIWLANSTQQRYSQKFACTHSTGSCDTIYTGVCWHSCSFFFPAMYFFFYSVILSEGPFAILPSASVRRVGVSYILDYCLQALLSFRVFLDKV